MGDLKSDSGGHLLKISGIGRDRPGIIHRIADVLKDSAGNILLQRSMRVAGDFAVVMVASVPTGGVEVSELEATLSSRLAEDYKVIVREHQASDLSPSRYRGQKYVVRVGGADRVGIVEEVTRFLAENNINIDAMESEVTHRPFDGTTTFDATFEMTAPDGFDMQKFSNDIEQIGAEGYLTIDIKRL